MQCPQCACNIPIHAKFCLECGTRLLITCDHCSTELPADVNFCPGCGQPARTPAPRSDAVPAHADTQAARAAPRTPTHLSQTERKRVTVLFADLKGSVELLADWDPEEARALLGAVVERMMQAVYLHEGRVNHVMGDGIMALFGAPLAQEDHAFRGCCAALAMQEAIREYNDERWRSLAVPLRIRVGLNSGEVVVGNIGNDAHTEYSAIGHTTNLAARMEQLAPPGHIYLTHDTSQLVAGFAQVNAVGPVPIKGLKDPIEVYDLVGIRSARTRLQVSATRGLSRLVGRQREMQKLQRGSEEAARGRGQIMALVGEAGVGKSRLVWEFTHSPALRDWLILESSNVAQGNVPAYQPIIDLLKIYFRIENEDDEASVHDKIQQKLARHKESHATLPAFLALLDLPVDDSQWQDLDPRQRRNKTLAAVKELLLRESEVQPLCIVFEDLQRIDLETQALLDSLVESLPKNRLFLLVNHRPEYEHRWSSKADFTQLRIEPLSRQNAEELLRSLIGENSQLSDLVDLLIERTDGNPLFLEESVQDLLETGVLAGERGAYRLVKPVESSAVPATVEAILATRIDRLSAADKHVLQTAAVLGRVVSLTLLERIAQRPEADLRWSLGRLQALDFLHETRVIPDPEYTFKHALTHEVAYGSLLNQRRKELDAAIVETIERLYAHRLLEWSESLAHHAFRGELWEKAVTYLQQTGTRAASRSAYGEATAHFENALAALSHLPETEENLRQAIQIRVELGPVLIATKGTGATEVEATYNEARDLCERIGETAKLFPVLWGLARSHVHRGDLRSGQAVGKQLLTVAERVRDPALLLEAHHTLWSTLFSCGELVSTRAHLEHGFELYDPEQHGRHAGLYGGHDPGVCCGTHAARVLWLLGYPDQAAQHARDAVKLAEKLAHPYSMASALHNATWTHQHRGDQPAAQRQSEALWALANEQGFPASIANAAVVKGWLLVQAGHGKEGIACMRERWNNLGRTRYHSAALLAEAYGNEGQIREGLNEVNQALAAAAKAGERFYEPELHRIKGELLLQHTRPNEEEANNCFQASIRAASEQGARSFELRAVTSLCRLLQQQGKRADGRRMLEEIYGWFTEGFDTADLKRAAALLKEL